MKSTLTYYHLNPDGSLTLLSEVTRDIDTAPTRDERRDARFRRADLADRDAFDSDCRAACCDAFEDLVDAACDGREA